MSKPLVVVPLLAALMAVSIAGVVHAQSVITMSAVEFAFEPATVRTSSGSVTFDLRNDGRFPHNFQFDGQAEPIFADDLTTGQSATATVDLAPGTYTFYCPVPGHRERGMVGTLTIAGAAQAARAGDFDPATLAGGLAILGAIVFGAGWLRRRQAIA